MQIRVEVPEIVAEFVGVSAFADVIDFFENCFGKFFYDTRPISVSAQARVQHYFVCNRSQNLDIGRNHSGKVRSLYFDYYLASVFEMRDIGLAQAGAAIGSGSKDAYSSSTPAPSSRSMIF